MKKSKSLEFVSAFPTRWQLWAETVPNEYIFQKWENNLTGLISTWTWKLELEFSFSIEHPVGKLYPNSVQFQYSELICTNFNGSGWTLTPKLIKCMMVWHQACTKINVPMTLWMKILLSNGRIALSPRFLNAVIVYLNNVSWVVGYRFPDMWVAIQLLEFEGNQLKKKRIYFLRRKRLPSTKSVVES